MFVNTLPMRNFPDPEFTYLQFLEQIRQNSLAAFENQDLQFETLVEKLNIGGDFSRNPLFDVMLMVQNIDRAQTVAKDVYITPYEGDEQTSKFDITLTATESEGNIDFLMEYATVLFRHETIENMGKRFLEIMEQAMENSDTKLKDFTLSHQLAVIEPENVIDEDGDFGF